ncbi:hypothetical protein D3C72_1517190 [compost metagenome]
MIQLPWNTAPVCAFSSSSMPVSTFCCSCGSWYRLAPITTAPRISAADSAFRWFFHWCRQTTGITSSSASTEVRDVSGSATTAPNPSTSAKAASARRGRCPVICDSP